MNSKKILSKKAFATVAALTMSATSLVQPALFTSNENVVSAATHTNYAKLLQQSLFFYDSNMCGKNVESSSLLTWRGNCHTSDEVDGGFHDAGDHAMFGLPQGFSASTLGWSYYEFKDAYEATGNTAHFKTISDYFNSFFKASTKLSGDTVSNFLYQKADGNEDHAYWGPPENQGGNRRMYWTSNGASDIAAEYAASLAISYLNFGNAEDLKYAEALYKFSTQYNQVASEGTGGFYENKSCQDEQAWAAGWLYLATKNEKYKNDCASKQTQYLGWVHGWENVGLGAACVYAHITGDWSKVNGWIGSQCTSNGYYFLDKWGSARLNASMQFTALVATKNSSADYGAWCQNQMDYLLGNNPANTCFVVGYASNSASKPHHRACSGTSTAEDNAPSKYVLVGALVGGPLDAGGSYQDSRADYICNEVAVDYNAGLVGAAAGLYSIYKTGTVESTIVGAKSNGVSNSTPSNPVTTTVTTTPSQGNNNTTTSKTTTTPKTTTTSTPSANGTYTLDVNKKYVYSQMDDKMIGFAYEDFGLKASSKEKITKVEVKLSASKNIGTWQGAFGSSTTVAADEYWTMTEDMEQSITSNSGTITWKVDSDTASIIQYGYGGELKFGVWWIDCGEFTIDSVTLYTSGGSTTTTSKTTTTTTTPKTTTSSNSNVAGDINCDGVVSATDVSAMMQSMVGKKSFSTQGKKNADLNGDGKISIVDLIKLKNLIL